jgi:hypothetical protein
MSDSQSRRTGDDPDRRGRVAVLVVSNVAMAVLLALFLAGVVGADSHRPMAGLTTTTGDGPPPTPTTGDGPPPTPTTGDGPPPTPTTGDGPSPSTLSHTGDAVVGTIWAAGLLLALGLLALLGALIVGRRF